MSRNQWISIVFVSAVIIILGLFINRTFDFAEKKDFWVDERYELTASVRGHSYWDILYRGAQGQGSPSPLEYLAVKFLDHMKEPFHSFGLPFNIYYRLNSIFSTLICGAIGVLLLFSGIQKQKSGNILLCVQAALLGGALWDYYFRIHNFIYAVETRPYALWNALWFLAMAMYLHYRKFNKPLILVLTLLAATVTASLFQMGSLMLSFVMVKLFDKERILEISKSIIKTFAIPLVVCFYYILGKVTHYGHVSGPGDFAKYSRQFFEFWLSMKMIPIVSLLGILMSSFLKNFRSHTIIFTALLILYCVSPAINYLTISKGMYFVHRQYRYYELIYPIFLCHLALALPSYGGQFKNFLLSSKRLSLGKSSQLVVMGGMVLFLCVCFIRDFKEMRMTIKTQTLNLYMPASYDYLVKLANVPVVMDKRKLKKYRRYYQKAVQSFPNRAAAYGILGFCHYHLGEYEKAIQAYQKAIEINPHFFWFYYNLGVIHFKEARYDQAAEYFHKAIAAKPEHALLFIRESKMVYHPIIQAGVKNFGRSTMEQLKAGYRDAQRLLILSQRYVRDPAFQKGVSQSLAEKIHLEVF